MGWLVFLIILAFCFGVWVEQNKYMEYQNHYTWKTVGTLELTLRNIWTGNEFDRTILLLEQEETHKRKFIGTPPSELIEALNEWKSHTLSTEQLTDIWS